MKRLVGAMAVAVLLLLSLYSGNSYAQTSSGTVSGYVVDQSKGAVPNALVKLVNQQTGVVQTTHAQGNGAFIFPAVQPGTFSIIVDAKGYQELVKRDLVLSASERLAAGTLQLTVGSVKQSVVVTAAVTPVQTTSSEVSGELDTQQIDNLLAIGRDFMSMTRTIPGVVDAGNASSLGSSTTPYVNGLRNVYNSANLDGVSGTPRPGQSMDTPPNLDAIQEVKILTSGYQAEYGEGAGGAVINVVTKSGTQRFHGTAYYYGRNEAFNANSWFNNYNGVARPRYRYNTIGGNIGGPVFWPGHFNSGKNKLFFFYSQEYWPTKSPDGLKKYMVPTALERTGDFSQTPVQGVISPGPNDYINIKMPGEPSSACPASGAGGNHSGCFSGNVLPPTAVNSSLQALLNVFPLPNFSDRVVSAGQYNYVTNYTSDKPTYQEIFRVDYNPTDKMQMYVRGLFELSNNDGYASSANKLPWLMRVNYQTPRQNIAYDMTYTFSPTLVNEVNFGTSTFGENQLYNPADLAKATKSSSGYNLGQIYPQNNPLNLYPAVSFGGVSNAATYGWDSRFPMLDRVRWWQATDNLTKILGNHNLKFGVNWATDHYLQSHSSSGTPEGSFSFGKDSKNPNDSNYAYANALEGLFDTYAEPTGRNDYNPRTYVYEWYGQDQWRVNKNLTIDYGVRFAWVRPPSLHIGSNFVPNLYKAGDAPTLYQYSSNGKNAVDPTTGEGGYPAAYAGLFVPNTGNLANGLITTINHDGYPEGLVHGEGLQLGPRLGFAYDPWGNGKTAFRGHFGVFIEPATQMGQEGDMTHNPPIEFVPTQYYGSVDDFTTVGGLIGPPSFGSAFELHPKESKVYGYGLDVQQEIGFGAVLDVGYVGDIGRNLTGERNINEVPYGAEFLPQNQKPGGGTLPDNFFRPYPGYSTIDYRTTDFSSNYNSMQVQVTRRFRGGLEFGLAYTWSKTMDYADEYDTSVATYQPLRIWNYGPALEDVRNNLVVNYLWSLPRVSRLWSNFLTKSVLDGWQISGIDSYVSGEPTSLGFSTSDSVNITGGGDGARVVLTGDPVASAPHKFAEYFDTSVVQRPTTSYIDPTSGQLVLSNGVSRMNAIYNPGHSDFDTALFKNFTIKERYNFQLRLETYNTFNSPQFNSVDGSAKFSPFTNGMVVNGQTVNGTSTQINGTFGQIDGTAGARVLQLAGRINF